MMMNTHNARILVVDDEPDVHVLLEKMLGSQGYTVDAAYSADEAYRAIDINRPDLIILDLMMPAISGLSMLESIRNDENLRDILVLIVSARDEQADRLEGLSHGADDYVSKPFHLRSLVRKIEHMLEKKQIQDARSKIQDARC
jgi:two-component system phosphate regulon response regulator PhoB